MKNGPKILILDIETLPYEVFVWDLWEQNVGLEMIKEEWTLLSWAAKWYQDPSGNVYGPHNRVMYEDVRGNPNPRNDSKILKGIWKLMDEADIIIGQNSKRFDIKKLNARFLLNKMKKPSSYKQLDTLDIAKKNFSLPSNKLAYTSDKLNTKYKKLEHGNFPGFKLWKECLKGNKEAFKELEKYNKHDVLSTEEYYNNIQAWDNSINFNIYHDAYHHVCNCGSYDVKKYGFAFTTTGKYQRFKCLNCGKESRDNKNILDKEKRDSLKRRT